MAKGIKIITIILILLTAVFSLVYVYNGHNGVIYTFAITFGTMLYHFLMRLIVGYTYQLILKNKCDFKKKWFMVKDKELKFYEFLKVKKWKEHIPTFMPELFDMNKHSLKEIAQAMCQAELVHETIIVLSFLPIISFIWFGAIEAFIITSALSALLDSIFVIVQRYNRRRVVRLIEKLENK